MRFLLLLLPLLLVSYRFTHPTSTLTCSLLNIFHNQNGSQTLNNLIWLSTASKNWQIPKYRVKNHWNTDTACTIGHTYLKLYPSRVFFYLKHVCISNQLNCTTIEKPRHWIPYHSLSLKSLKYLLLLTCIAYYVVCWKWHWPVGLDRRV